MSKVSIGLRGWRFDEDEVFTEDGDWKPLDEMKPDVRQRVARLPRLVSSPCDACWLVHGDENIEECNVPAAVYGEPLAEALLCEEHEADFLYWFREEGGREYAGSEEMSDAFHEWFLDGNRAPEGYGGLEHVDTDPDHVPTPDIPDQTCDFATEEGVGVETDVQGTDEMAANATDDASADEDDLSDLDLSAEYPSK